MVQLTGEENGLSSYLLKVWKRWTGNDWWSISVNSLTVHLYSLTVLWLILYMKKWYNWWSYLQGRKMAGITNVKSIFKTLGRDLINHVPLHAGRWPVLHITTLDPPKNPWSACIAGYPRSFVIFLWLMLTGDHPAMDLLSLTFPLSGAFSSSSTISVPYKPRDSSFQSLDLSLEHLLYKPCCWHSQTLPLKSPSNMLVSLNFKFFLWLSYTTSNPSLTLLIFQPYHNEYCSCNLFIIYDLK